MALLEISNLNAYYYEASVLQEISLCVNKNEMVSVIGPNGAGKSTLLKSISRLVRSEGQILLGGEPLNNLSPFEVVKKGVIHCPEGRELFPHMTVRDNLLMGAFLRSKKEEMGKDLKKVYDLFPILKTREKQMAATLSGGEQQMLAIARAIMANPLILMLDEPSLGLAPLIIENIFEVIKNLNKEGLSVLLVEQNAALSMEVSQRTYILEDGKIVNEGKSEELKNNTKIKEIYMGIA